MGWMRHHLICTSVILQDIGAKASPQLQQARQQAETLLLSLQVCEGLPHQMLWLPQLSALLGSMRMCSKQQWVPSCPRACLGSSAASLLNPVQREAAAHQTAEAELAAAVEAAAAEADALRQRVSELEAAQAAPDRQSVAAVQQQAVAAERWAAAAQVCPDIYSPGSTPFAE
jgi:hypothetical protein